MRRSRPRPDMQVPANFRCCQLPHGLDSFAFSRHSPRQSVARPAERCGDGGLYLLKGRPRTMRIKDILVEIFTWWNGQTMGTRFFTWRKGEFVGEDEFGNKYYCERGGDKRWVIYNGLAEASAIPPGWHGWMHHRVDTAPSEEQYHSKGWQISHKVNPTGTPEAYRPDGSILTPEKRPEVTGDYQAWTPGQ